MSLINFINTKLIFSEDEIYALLDVIPRESVWYNESRTWFRSVNVQKTLREIETKHLLEFFEYILKANLLDKKKTIEESKFCDFFKPKSILPKNQTDPFLSNFYAEQYLSPLISNPEGREKFFLFNEARFITNKECNPYF